MEQYPDLTVNLTFITSPISKEKLRYELDMIDILSQIRSRHIVMASHFVVGLGFALGPQLVGMYLSQDEVDDSICDKATSNSHPVNLNRINETAFSNQSQVDLETPFQMVAWAQIVGGFLYLVPLLIPMEMPGEKH